MVAMPVKRAQLLLAQPLAWSVILRRNMGMVAMPVKLAQLLLAQPLAWHCRELAGERR